MRVLFLLWNCDVGKRDLHYSYISQYFFWMQYGSWGWVRETVMQNGRAFGALANMVEKELLASAWCQRLFHRMQG